MQQSGDHLATVGESYFEHMRAAFGFGGKLVLSGLACLAHGIVPGLFVTTGSRAVTELHDRMVINRRRRPGRTTRFIAD